MMVMSIKIRMKRWRLWNGGVVVAVTVIVVETGKVKVMLYH